MNDKIPERLTVGQVKAILRLLNVGLNNAHDKRAFIRTAVNPEDIISIIKGDK